MSWTQEDIDRRNRDVLGVGVVTAASNMSAAALQSGAAAELCPEWMIEAECTKLLEEDDWRALRTDPVSDRGRGKGFGELGMADHLYIRYGQRGYGFDDNAAHPRAHSAARVLWIEFKSASGKPKKHQLEWHAKERARGALTLIAGVDFPASVAGFVAWYAGSGLRRRA